MEHFAWPLAALVFGVVFLFVFRPQLEKFLGSVKSVTRDGVTTRAEDQGQVEKQAVASPAPTGAQALLETFDSPVLRQREQAICADLLANKLDTSSETTKVLVRYLAKTQIALGCQIAYRLIFGSQIAFLKRANSSPAGVSAADAKEFYQRVAEIHSDVFQSEEPKPYFDFLLNQKLLVFKDGAFHITDFGREFLTWLIHVGESENKPL